jgi:hypothetical protein
MLDKLKSVMLTIIFIVAIYLFLAPITTYQLVTNLIDNTCFQCIIDNLKQ